MSVVPSRSPNSRNWCFILPSPEQFYSEVVTLENCKYAIWQLEHDTGGRCIRGYIQFHNRKSLLQVSRVLSTAFWYIASRSYSYNHMRCSCDARRIFPSRVYEIGIPTLIGVNEFGYVSEIEYDILIYSLENKQLN